MKTYKSKISFGLFILIAIPMIYPTYDCIIHKEWIPIVIFLIPIIFIFYVFSNIKYKIENLNLNISFIFLDDQNINIKTINKISETYNPISSPAASIDRLEIIYNNGKVLVSPKDKKGFIGNLLEINPNIEVVYRKK